MVATVVQLTESKKHIQHTHRVFEDQKKAFRNNPMPSLTERQENLKRLKRVLLSNQERILDAIDRDFSCRSKDESLIAEVMPSIQGINYTLKNLESWMKPSKRHVSVLFQPASNRVHYQPKGVVGVIVPWNYPLYLAVGPLVASLAAGNRTMIKMSEFTPHTSALFKEIVESAFPEDLVCVINGEADVAADFSSRPFDHLLFTGSTSVGKLVMRAAAENLTPVTLELGGKSPNIVFDDCGDLVEVARQSARAIFANSGQVCVAGSRLLVHETIREPFLDALAKAADATVVADPLRLDSQVGAIGTKAQLDKNVQAVEQARQAGDTVIAGGERIAGEGYFFRPTVIAAKSEDSPAVREEIFGPVLTVQSFRDEDEAVRLANDTPYGLASGVWSQNISRAHRMVGRLQAGVVHVNCYGGADITAPLVGTKQSGNGFDRSLAAIEKYQKRKTAWIRIA